MVAIGKIYTYPNNPRVFKALIAAKYNGQTVEESIVQMGVDNKKPEFLTKFPLGKVPAFEGSDHFTLFESNAIAQYVASQKDDTKLFGKTKKESALVQQFIALSDNELAPALAAWVYPVLGFYPLNEAATKKAKEDIVKFLTFLNKHLLTRTFLVTEYVTLADIFIVSSLLLFYKHVFDPEFRAPFGNVNRWFLTCVNQPFFKEVIGELPLCVKMQVAQPKKAEPKAEPKKAEPKAEKPKKKKDADDDEPEEENYQDEKPKGKNPLDLLPKSSFVLDDWKRFYSNNETRPTACDWFWKNFDSEGYSIFKLDYKYNNELTLVFMSSNLIGGFFQRLESARKYAFGSLVILGEDNKNEITGYFVFRGSDIPQEVQDAADFESYKFTKVNPKEKAVQEAFNAVIAWDAKIAGKTFADGKIFK